MKTKWTAEKLIEFENRVKKMFEEGKIKAPVHLCGGNEVDLIHLFDGIREEDFVISTHRNHYHYLLKGGNEQGLVDELLGKTSGICGGYARSMNIVDPLINFYSSAIVGGGCAIAAGIALGLKKMEMKRKKKSHVWCFIGDGAEDSGHFMEAARFGVSRRLPLTFIVEDNDRSTDSSKADRWVNFPAFNCQNVLRYEYRRTYPHVGIGKHVSM